MDKLEAKLKRPRRQRRYGKRLLLGLMLVALLAIGLSMLSNAILPAHSHSQVTGRLSDLDKARLAEVFHLRHELGDALWPGWGQADIPVILYDEEYAFLTMYPDPPPGWLKMPEHSRHGSPWEPLSSDTLAGQSYYRQRLPGPDDTPEAFTVMVGERWVASMATKEWAKIEFSNQIRNGLPPLLKLLLPYRLMARLMLSVIGSDGYICGVLHESFHAYQGIKAPSRLADAEKAVALLDSRYPWDDKAFNGDWHKEIDFLAGALTAKSETETRERTLQFLTQRQKRRAAYGLKADFINLERQREWEEGLAKYTELAIWRSAATTPGFHSVPSLSADPDFKHYTTFERRWSQEVAQLRREKNAQDGRFYYTGMAQAFLLDRLVPVWKTKALTEGVFLEDLLKGVSLGVVGSIGAQPQVSVGGGAQSEASAGGEPAPIQAQTAQAGSLEVRLHPQEGKLEPPAELVLTDPLGRRTGFDPRGVESFQAIPDSSYDRIGLDDDQTGEPGPVTLDLYVAHPPAGEYGLQVIARTRGGANARTSGRYSLEIRALDRELNTERVIFKDVPVDAGGVHAYRIRYSGAPGVPLEIVAPPGIQRSAEQ